MVPLTDPQKFSPSKVSRYTVSLEDLDPDMRLLLHARVLKECVFTVIEILCSLVSQNGTLSLDL